MLSGKKLKLILLLNKSNERFFEAEEIASELEISLRTVYRYIKDINSLSDNKKPLIDSKQGIGYRINFNSPIVQDILNKHQSPEGEISEEQKELIKVIFENKDYSLYQLEQRYFMSAASVYRLIAKANEKLESFGFKLQFNKKNHLDIIGDEEKIRIWMLKNCLEDSEFVEILEQTDSLESIQKELSKIEGCNLSDQDKYMMSVGILICKNRKNCEINKKDNLECPIDEVIDRYKLNLCDRAFLLKILEVVREFEDEDFVQKVNFVIETSLETLIEKQSARREYVKDVLIGRLTRHIIELLKRSAFKISTSNPYLEEIQSKYPFEYNLAGFICYQLGSELEIKVTKEEIAYIAIYLVTLAKKVTVNSKEIDAMIVCDNALSTGYLLGEEISQHFPYIKIKGVVLKDNLSLSNNIDILISTTKLEKDYGISTIVINKLFDLVSITKINQELEKLSKKSEKSEKLFQSKVVDLESDTFDGCLEEIVGEHFSLKDGKEIVRKLLERENLAPTAIGKDVAFPHTIVENLDETMIIVGVSQKGIKWQKETVHVIFTALFSPKNLSQMGIFRSLYKFVQEDELIKDLVETKSLKGLLNFIGGNTIDDN